MAAVKEDVSVSQWDSDQPCQVLTQLFPGGLEDPDHLRELAPEGWERSPLRLVFHPTLEQAYAEAVALHTNIQELRQPGAQPTAAAPPSFEQIRQEYRDEPLRPREEYADLIGYCLWDIFSDGHDVWTAEGVQVDLGSFRGAAGLIAEFRQFASAAKDEFRRGWDYLDFYMGTIFVRGRADCTPVYELIFRRMYRLGLDWRYAHPRLGLVEFGDPEDFPDETGAPEWMGYDPSKAIGREQERRRRREATAELQEALDQAYRESVQEARKNPPPRTVQAYRNVYGRWPDGGPPEETPWLRGL